VTRSSPAGTTAWLVAALTVVTAAGCTHDELRTFHGVTEGEVVKLAAPVAGNLSSLDVTRGGSSGDICQLILF